MTALRRGGPKVGIFGGSFDPIHEGHLLAAEDTASALGLAKVYVVPTGLPPHKRGLIAAPEHRLAMARLSAEGRSGLEVSGIEIAREGYSYTVETVAEFRRALGADAELHLFLGTDAARDLPLWRDIDGIFAEAEPVVLERPGTPPVDWDRLAGELPPGLVERLRRSAVRLRRPVDISSTEIRRRLAEGLPVDRLLPPAVEEYIRAHGLYGTAGRS